MGILRDDQPPPLYVPDLSRPAGAAVAEDGTVGCVTCGTRLPPSKMDVVGQGFRCSPCSHKAELAMLSGGVDAAANLSAADRGALRESGTQKIVGGVAMTVLGACIVAFLPRGGLALMFGGVATASFGWQRRRAAG